MKREIKFRAWNEHLKFMTNSIHKLDSFNEYLSKDNYTVEQFTGLRDKNGVDIYENDIIKDSEGVIFRVYGVYGGFVIKAAYWANNTNDLTPMDELIFEPLSEPQTAQWIQEICEVIGNIHQNKDLLKN